MDQQIDSLSLKIGIDIKEDEIKKLKSFTDSIRNLQKSLQSLDLNKLDSIRVPKGLKNFQVITQNFKNIEQETVNKSKTLNLGNPIKDANELQSKFRLVAKGVSESAYKINSQVPKLEQNLTGYQELIDKFLGTSFEKKKGKTIFDKIGVSLKRIKLIAFVKLIRGIINFIAKGLNAGVQNLAVFDKEFNKTVSGIKTAITQTFNGITLIFRPIIEVIEPFLQQVSSTVAGIANQISEIQAKAKGQAKYTKISAKYADDYAKSLQKASLFNFDTFNTLNLSSSGFETADVSEVTEDDNQKIKALSTIKDFVSTVFETLKSALLVVKDIWVAIQPIVKVVLEVFNTVLKPINTVIQGIATALEPIFTIMGSISSKVLDIALFPFFTMFDSLDQVFKLLTPILNVLTEMVSWGLQFHDNVLSNILDILEPIRQLVSGIWDSFSKIIHGDFSGAGESLKTSFSNAWDSFTEKVKQLFTVKIPGWVDDIFKKIEDKLNIFSKKDIAKDFPVTDDFFTKQAKPSGIQGYFQNIAKASQENAWAFVKSLFGHANGGMVGAGEVWRMNEFGNPEMLFNAEQGNHNTNVINLEQITQAFTNAIFNSGLIEAVESSGGVYIDGREIAQSKSFKNEINRTNPQIRLR